MSWSDKEFVLHDPRTFSGLFGSTDGGSQGLQVTGIGVASAPDRRFVGSALASNGTRSSSCSFDISPSGIRTWSKFLAETVSDGAAGIMCADTTFLRAWTESPIASPSQEELRDDLPNLITTFEVRPIVGQMARAYLELLREESPSSLELADFLGAVAMDPTTHCFLTLPGLAHSAQDIFRFLTSDQQFSVALAAVPGGGGEAFILGRDRPIPRQIQAMELGLAYFGTEERFGNLPKSYRVKLAVLEVCRQYDLRFGYSPDRSDRSRAASTREDP
jgi:hypothetical protein